MIKHTSNQVKRNISIIIGSNTRLAKQISSRQKQQWIFPLLSRTFHGSNSQFSTSKSSSPTINNSNHSNHDNNTESVGRSNNSEVILEFRNLISKQFSNKEGFIKASFSEGRWKETRLNSMNTIIEEELNLEEGIVLNRFSVRPIIISSNKEKSIGFQFSLFLMDGKAIHRNFENLDKVLRLIEILVVNGAYQQVLIQSSRASEDLHITLKYEKDSSSMKQMKVNKVKTISPKNSVEGNEVFSHNRKKDYILEEGKLINFLVELGIQHEKSAKILSQKYNKFKQMNHFLEIFKESISSILNHHKGNSENLSLRIVDFGCGKSYLTFAIHYYLKEVLKIGNIQIIGLDLKKDVIDHCNSISKKYSFDNELKFILGDIHSFDAALHFDSQSKGSNPNDDSQVDIVVSLHACNTATDKALEQAIRWKSKCIMAVPCCHHEIYQQMKHLKSLPENHFMESLLQHNIFNEKFSSIYTDTLRCQLLEIMGYKTNVIEFIDMEHTPKNVMIRATRSTNLNPERRAYLVSKYQAMLNNIPVKITLEKLLFPQGLEPQHEK